MPDKISRNIRLTIEYDGTNYCGWQVQSRNPSKKSIQEVIEKVLRKILREKIKLIASGRTDAGVHARAQVSNFKTSSQVPADKIQKALNCLLPDDISIHKAEIVPADFHSRFDARSKTYRYTILNRRYPSALYRGTVYFFQQPLNVPLMRKESRALLGRHNFKSFRLTDKKERNPVRTIKKISVRKTGGLIEIDIEANGFLYNMARSIAGTLIEIGRGKFPPGSMKGILASKNRKFAGPTAPAKGLCLLKVSYR
jgi:tRNA pseudouridine38-40 synthase